MYNPASIFKPSALPGLAETSLFDLMNETTAVYAIDLNQHLFYMSQERDFLDMLLPPPPGVYAINTATPILRFDHHHYFSHDARTSRKGLADITCYEDFKKVTGPIYTRFGQRVMTVNRNGHHHYTDRPRPHWSAYHLTIAGLMDYFHRLCDIIKPDTNIPESDLDISQYVQARYLNKQYLGYMEQGRAVIEETGEVFSFEASMAMTALLNEVYGFVGRDKHHVYRINVVGMSIYIEKGIDSRVVEYHRYIQSHMDAIKNEDTVHRCHQTQSAFDQDTGNIQPPKPVVMKTDWIDRPIVPIGGYLPPWRPVTRIRSKRKVDLPADQDCGTTPMVQYDIINGKLQRADTGPDAGLVPNAPIP